MTEPTAWDLGIIAAAMTIWDDDQFTTDELIRAGQGVQAFLAQQSEAWWCEEHSQGYPYPFICDGEDEACTTVPARIVVEPSDE